MGYAKIAMELAISKSDGEYLFPRYVRGGNLASVRRSEFGKVFVLPVLHESVAFADLGRMVPTPKRARARPLCTLHDPFRVERGPRRARVRRVTAVPINGR